MEFSHSYSFAIGTSSELQKEPLSLYTTNSLETLPQMSESGIIIPRFVGIYQSDQFLMGSKESKSKDKIRSSKKMILTGYRTAIRKKLRSLGISDTCNPELICIAYDSNNFQDGLVRSFFKQVAHRVKISPLEDIPDFNQKDPKIHSEIIRRFEEGLRNYQSETEKYKIAFDIFRETLLGLQQQFNTYGLTLEEYEHRLRMEEALEYCALGNKEFIDIYLGKIAKRKM